MSHASAVLASSLPRAQSSGLAALAVSNQQLNQDAQQIANPDNQNVSNSLLDLNQVEVLAQSGAAVISASNQMLGTLLDVFA